MSEKVALVTGGTRGIGEAICKNFLANSFRVITCATNAERNARWLDTRISEGYSNVDCYVCDVGDYEECRSTVADIERKYGQIDILVNNAGITRDASLKKMTKEYWDAVLRTNLDSLFNITSHVLPLMLNRNYGRIINISSVNGEKGQFGQTNYAAAKAGAHGFTKSLAREVSNKNITVNTVSPGYIQTDMMASIPKNILDDIIGQIPVGRLGRPEEIAEVVYFLTTGGADYITGSIISVNGGLHMY
ncbi:acetoacetyl-CoA reductase [Paenibacillus sp. HN-1]|uniref:acetoacetyl-CoA reductase n=1 Tax=Paenibacillus TaxID=44249 RepID=UPI001CAA22FC|nr:MULTISPECIES: acetoacetyl-CoA reductase [Paenibacillus]MBY9078045.1 acetoacetyl-CoA reductase [Paenibacillus sp. CGMCC 1.18879]MBY9083786.1 acetoacetyl-CoA reductase [Paenibacillus sinensis]